MGLFDLFQNKKEICKTDACIDRAMQFIETIHSFDSLDCPMFSVGFGDDSISFRFFDCDNTAPCIYMNMIYRKQAEEDAINPLIGAAIHANDLPEKTSLEWHFNESEDKYDSYVLQYSVPTEHKKCSLIYLDYVKSKCQSKGFKFVQKESFLHFELK